MISAKVICHSKAPCGEELITMEVEFHRFILAEVNTHRVLSRNYQSSRAVPVEKMIEQVRNGPAIPIHWGKNQKGMSAGEELESGAVWWRSAAISAAQEAEYLNTRGYHKQVVNRLLEPFMWTKGVITATKKGWESVFKLRLHKDAQPEFQALAYKIKKAIEASNPNHLQYGDWHLPYTNNYTKEFIKDNLETTIKISTSCTAQVSYRTLDDSLDKATKIYDMLNLPSGGIFKEGPPHFSPAEHVALIINEENARDCGWTPSEIGGNFNTLAFYQYRKMLERGTEQEYI